MKAMKNPQNIAVFLLLATAAILTGLLVTTYHQTGQSASAEVCVKQGEYIFSPGRWSKTMDLVYVIDIGARRLNVYWVNINTNAVDLVDTYDLNRLFAR